MLTSKIQVHLQQAFAFQQRGQFSQAQALYENILRSHPNHAEALHLLGLVAAQTNNLERAVHLIGKAIAAKPDYIDAWFNYANVLKDLKRFDEAIASYDRVISFKPGHAAAYSNRGVALRELKHLESAVASYDKALAIKPDYIEAHYNRGNVLKELNQFSAAVASYDRILAIKPEFAMAHVNRGNALKELKQLDAAVASYEKAIAIQPEFAEAHWNKAVTLLLAGDFERGWPLYEWRWGLNAFGPVRRNFTQPLWLGQEPIAEKTILLHGEQGLGDAIQFCRYVRLVSALGAKVILEVDGSLVELLKDLAGVSELISKGSELPPFDCHCPLLSLPLAFKTEAHTIPCSPKYLSANMLKKRHWQAKLGNKTKPLVGLAWSGNKEHRNDHNRSIVLSELMRQLPNECQYVSLQKEMRSMDQATFESNPQIMHFGSEFEDFADTAALCELMDVVISVDTSIAHLAGALGKPTWILLSFIPDWRWLLEGGNSSWYPTVKLYRQPATNDWNSILSEVSTDLIQFVRKAGL